MDFFQQQDTARKNTVWMVFLFIMGVICVVLAIDAMAYLFVSEDLWNPKTPEDFQNAVKTLVFISCGTLLVIFLGSFARISQLRTGGGRSVAEMLGGRLVDRSGASLKEQQLLNIVEEMSIASGIPVPPVYVMDEESSINAFAAGNSPEDAVVAVTRGALETFNREEMQGVIGHEFSHILNGDMRLSIRLMGILYGILLIYTIGYYILFATANSRSSSSSEKESGGGKLFLFLISLWAMIVGLVGVFFGNIIKAAVSRQREYLADASSAQFTRNPKGLANALLKISRMAPSEQTMKSAAASEASHLFFTDYSSSFWARLFATHPPLAKRIARLDSASAADLQKLQPQKSSATESPVQGLYSQLASSYQNSFPASNLTEQNAVGRNAASASVSPASSVTAASSVSPAAPVTPTAAVFARNTNLRVELSNSLSACAYILAILTDSQNVSVANAQKTAVFQVFQGALRSDYVKHIAHISILTAAQRLMFLQLAIPALKQLSAKQYVEFRDAIRALISADGVVDLNEYVIYTMTARQLDIVFGLRRASKGTGTMTYEMFGSVIVVLSRLARVGSSDPAAQERAFRLGVQKLNVSDAVLLSEEECSNRALETSLSRLDTMEFSWKRTFLDACELVIYADGVQTDDEAVLLYGITAALGVYNS